MKIIHVINADFFRWFGKKKLFLSFFTIICLNYFIILQNIQGFFESNIVDLIFYYMDDPFYILNFMIAAVLMGISYCEEKEKGYFIFWIKRCDKKTYVISKIINCFLSAFFLLTTGMFSWIISLRIFLPWINGSSDQFQIITEQGLGYLLKDGHYLLYYCLYCIGIGMMAGILSVGTFTLSLFIEKQSMVILTAAVLFYLNVSYLGSISASLERWSMQQILYFPFRQTSSAGTILLEGILYTVMMILPLAMLSYWWIKRRDKYD